MTKDAPPRASVRAMKRSTLFGLPGLPGLARLPGLGVAILALTACGGPSAKSAADVDDDSNPKPASEGTAAASDADGGATASTESAGPPAPGSADDSTGPKKDECSVFDEPNIEGVLLKSACEVKTPTGQPPDTSKTLLVKATISPNILAPGGHGDVLVSFTNKSTAVLPLYFTIDPMPRFDI
jgi:hypothetical protein